jgi:zinc-binding alcohol dehydrogenase/oxidoreductase
MKNYWRCNALKAVLLRELGGPDKLKLEEIDIPKPRGKEVLIKLKYAALNRRDVFITYGLYPGMKLPTILGSDGSGEVVEIGDEVTSVSINDEVVINPGLNWGDNDRFSNPEFQILGMPVNGTYAQYVVVPEENVYPKPNHLNWEEAAALPLAGVTAYRALFTRGEVQKGEKVLIPGIGSGVALFALQMANAVGADVYVTSSSDEKIEQAIQLGAKGGVNYKKEKWAKELKNIMGFADLVIDGVGGPSFNDFIYLTAPGGRIVSFGATSGPIPEFVMPRVFFKNMDIRGTTMGSPRDFMNMLSLYEKHSLHPVIDRTYSLEEVKQAQVYMEEGKNFGKITLKIKD